MITPPSYSARRPSDRRRVCLFAEHHRGGRLPRTTIQTLQGLAQAGFAVHAALSGTEVIDSADASILERIGVSAHPRANAGLDFGAWQALIRAGAAYDADEVLLANDSVFGPFRPLAPIVRAMAGFDAWGMVESREGRPHLQSWFVWMSGAAFRSAAVQRVFAQPFASMGKPEIITHGELGLAAAFEVEALDVGARYRDVFRARPSTLVATNPMHFRWRALLSSGAVPFLKVELLRDNPSRIIGVEHWDSVLEELGVANVSTFHAALIEATGRSSGGFYRTPHTPMGVRQTILQLAIRTDRAGLLRELALRPMRGRLWRDARD